MIRTIAVRRLGLAIAGMLLASGCTVSEGGSTKTTDTVVTAAGAAPAVAAGGSATQPAPTSAMPADSGMTSAGGAAGTQPGTAPGTAPAAGSTSPAPKPLSPLRLEVDLTARKASLFEGDKLLETHRVAVGSPKWPTQTGEWNVVQVVFNPEWIPPDESWAEQREPKKPGAPDNPLGRAQLVYDPPRTIHGTNEPQSIGKAVSHGSIRMANAEIVALAKRILAASGAAKDSAWFRQADTERTKKQIVDLPMPVPIRVF